MPENNFDVVIVGAGPAGLVAACLLNHYGINFCIFDKKAGPTATSNALLVNMRTLQLLESLGIADDLIANGLKLQGMSVYSSGKLIVKANTDEDLPFNFLLTIPQAKTESILRSYLEYKGVEIHDNWELLSHQQNDDNVELTVNTPQGETKINTAWLFGCDGYKSPVRQQSNIEYLGHDIKSHFIMIDAEFNSEHTKNSFCGFFKNNLTLGVIPYNANGQARLLAEVGRSEKFNSIDEPTLEDMQSIAKECIPFKHEIKNMSWSSKFWVHERLAESYSKGRVFLVGDAAHVHSPAGGMGMNTGIQDAFNLCWKINLHLHNQAPIKILETYNEERRPIGNMVLQRSSRMTKAMTIKSKTLHFLRNLLMKTLFKFKSIRHSFMLMNNQLDIKYTKSSITKDSDLSTSSQGPTTGMAAPNFILHSENKTFNFYKDMDPKYFYVLCFGDANNSEQITKIIGENNWPIIKLDATNIDNKNKKTKWPQHGFIIIRPDTYIALATKSENKIVEYFQNIFD